MFFVVIQHLTRSRWCVVVRRIAETLGAVMPLLAVLSIPIFVGMHDLYHWTHAELTDPASPDYDPIIGGKTAYLNTPFFIIRAVIYFVAWSYIGTKLYSLSLRQDVTSDQDRKSTRLNSSHVA